MLDGESLTGQMHGDGSFEIHRPPLLSPHELRRWQMLYGIENEAAAQAQENARRRKGG